MSDYTPDTPLKRCSKCGEEKPATAEYFTTQEWKRALRYFNGCCAVCGRQGKDLFGVIKIAADHWIPLNSPNCPGTVATNILPLCHGLGGCNNKKRDVLPEQWLIEQFGKRKAGQIIQRIEGYFTWLKSLQ